MQRSISVAVAGALALLAVGCQPDAPPAAEVPAGDAARIQRQTPCSALLVVPEARPGLGEWLEGRRRNKRGGGYVT